MPIRSGQNSSPSTFLGGSGYDKSRCIKVDTHGNVWIAGRTESSDFPGMDGTFDGSYNGGSDGFVAKFNHDLTRLMACTFIGGRQDDECYSLDFDEDGNVYVGGSTDSLDFPVSKDAYCQKRRGGRDVFVAKFDNDLRSLLYSTLIGGRDSENCRVLKVDTVGSVYLAGTSSSRDFPITAGAFAECLAGKSDVYILKLSEALDEVLAATFVGGSGNEMIWGLEIEPSGSVFISGKTESSDFPVTEGSFDETYNGGGSDVFVSRMGGDLKQLIASTYLGGDQYDPVYSMALDQAGNVYVGGHSFKGFPITHSVGGYTEGGYVSKFNSSLKRLLASTFIGYGNCVSLVIDRSGYIHVGRYGPWVFPTTPGAIDESFNGGLLDAGITRVSPDLNHIQASTFVGGNREEWSPQLTPEYEQGIYLAVETGSADLPVNPDSFDKSFNGDYDIYVSRSHASLRSSKIDEVFQSAKEGEIGRLEIALNRHPGQVNIRDSTGRTMLHWAAKYGQHEVAELLLSAGADRDALDKRKVTPLYLAAVFNNRNVFDLLLAQGASLEISDLDGQNLLHHAVFWKQADLMELLIAKGLNLNATDFAGNTPLHCAVEKRFGEGVKLLLINGATPGLRNKEGMTPYDLAEAMEFKELADLLSEPYQKDTDQLH